MTSRWSSLLRYFSSTREAAILKFCLHEEGWAMWGPGSSGPVAIRVGYAPGTGRGVFAVRDIAVGDLTHTADPVVAHPALAYLQKACYYCLQRIKKRQNTGRLLPVTNGICKHCQDLEQIESR
ncbi:hypothetical protein CY35_12G014600 [Sphagnum magellanicum]|nr:hypothetical protein CY35_12G014600 [Sphagnum magellanicum]